MSISKRIEKLEQTTSRRDAPAFGTPLFNALFYGGSLDDVLAAGGTVEQYQEQQAHDRRFYGE